VLPDPRPVSDSAENSGPSYALPGEEPAPWRQGGLSRAAARPFAVLLGAVEGLVGGLDEGLGRESDFKVLTPMLMVGSWRGRSSPGRRADALHRKMVAASGCSQNLSVVARSTHGD